MKLLICPLVSWDLKRSVRCIQSCQDQWTSKLEHEIAVVINTKDSKFLTDITNWCGKNRIHYFVSNCDGTASTGKNEVFKYFLSTDCTHLSQVDGDDVLYPSFLKHIERHLNRSPRTDVLGILPKDYITNLEPVGFPVIVNENVKAGVWGINYYDIRDKLGFGEDLIYSNRQFGAYFRYILFSKNVAREYRYDPKQKVGEDHALHFHLLKGHIEDKLLYWISTASDTYLKDDTGHSYQKRMNGNEVDGITYICNDSEMNDKNVELCKTLLEKGRSSPGELPVDYAPLLMGESEKSQFIKTMWSDYERLALD